MKEANAQKTKNKTNNLRADIDQGLCTITGDLKIKGSNTYSYRSVI